MNQVPQIHYLEIVTLNVEQVCSAHAETFGIQFSDEIAELGGARTADLSTGGTLGVRAPMHEAEEPVTRPYYLVSDIEKALEDGKKGGAEVALPPMEIPGRGQCAILMFGATQSGLWQL